VTEEPTASRGSSHSTLRGSPFPPIAEYGFLSDCEVFALIAASGAVEWMCLPRMDGPSVFAANLDRDAGSFRLGPADVTVPAGRRYLPGTMVLETTVRHGMPHWPDKGLDLSAVRAGRYDMICLPVKLHSSDGTPARAILRPVI
jgi:Domain of unknown function (DUF5911)